MWMRGVWPLTCPFPLCKPGGPLLCFLPLAFTTSWAFLAHSCSLPLSPPLPSVPPPLASLRAVTFPNCSVGRPVPSTQAWGRGGVPQLFCSGPVPPTQTPTVVASAGENRLGAPAYPLPYFPPTSQVEWGSGSRPREGGAARRNSPPDAVNKGTENPNGRLRHPPRDSPQPRSCSPGSKTSASPGSRGPRAPCQRQTEPAERPSPDTVTSYSSRASPGAWGPPHSLQGVHMPGHAHRVNGG